VEQHDEVRKGKTTRQIFATVPDTSSGYRIINHIDVENCATLVQGMLRNDDDDEINHRDFLSSGHTARGRATNLAQPARSSQ